MFNSKIKTNVSAPTVFCCFSNNFTKTLSQSSVGFSPAVEENCELSDRNSHDLDIENPSYYDQSERHDFYQREAGGVVSGGAGCLDGECGDG